MIEENGEYYDPLLDGMDMATLMEDVDSESGSQNGLLRIPPTRKKGLAMTTLERPGISGRYLYHKQWQLLKYLFLVIQVYVS